MEVRCLTILPYCNNCPPIGSKSDSSDEDEDTVNESPNTDRISAVGKKKKKQKNKEMIQIVRKEQNISRSTESSNVLYVGHLPREFQEPELLEFLKQFGQVKNVRLARSKKTGGTKCYAFCQMKDPEVAAIVADTLSGYIMFGTKRLVCHVVPSDKVHPKLFFQFAPKKKTVQKATKPVSRIKEITERLVERERKKRKALADMGIEYDFPGYEAEANEKNEGDDDEGIDRKEKKEKEKKISNKKGKKKRRKMSDASISSANSEKDPVTADESKADINTPEKKKSTMMTTEKQALTENSKKRRKKSRK